MKRVFLYLTVLILTASIAQPLLQISSANTKVRHTVIAASGDAAPAGGNYLSSSFANVSLNARHDVAFDASVGVTTGVFVGDGKTTTTTALGDTFGFVSNPFITANGDVVFDANNTDTYRSDGKSVVHLVSNGDPAPGGGTLSPSGRVTNDNGAIAFTASVSDSTATQGIFRSDGTQTVAIARDDMTPPTGGSFLVIGSPAINDRGQVPFYSVMTGGTSEFGIFRGEGQDLTPIFVTNQIGPGGQTFADFGNPVINNHGQVAATVSFTNNEAGIFVGDGTDTGTIAIAIQQQAAPKGGNYNGTFQVPTRLNDRGEVAFAARLTGGTSSTGLFRGDGKSTIPIALVGTNAPGTTGTFATFRDFQLLNNGRVAFIATLTVGVGGVTTANNTGIWVGTSDEDLQLVARTGDIIDGKVLTRLPALPLSGQLEMNENSIVWVGTFGIAKAVVLSRVLGNDEVE
ncbi:MAG TPA: choice-of-anchor tandem repeat NxxGxxAF-containing protein [Pyrinomonadaceae bacterium]